MLLLVWSSEIKSHHSLSKVINFGQEQGFDARRFVFDRKPRILNPKPCLTLNWRRVSQLHCQTLFWQGCGVHLWMTSITVNHSSS